MNFAFLDYMKMLKRSFIMLPVIDFMRISLRKRSILGMIFLLILMAVPASADVDINGYTEITADTEWSGNIHFGPQGSVQVTNAELVIKEGTVILDECAPDSRTRLFDVREKGTLTFTDNSLFDLTNLASRRAVQVTEGTLYLLKSSKIANANRTTGHIGPVISIVNGTFLIDSGTVENNTVIGDNLVRMEGGMLQIENAVISGNTATPEQEGNRNFSADGTYVSIVSSEIRNNHECVFTIYNTGQASIHNSVFEENSNESPYYGSALAVYNSTLSIDGSSKFIRNTTKGGTTIFAADDSVIGIIDAEFSENDNGTDDDIDAVVFGKDSYIIAHGKASFSNNKSRAITVFGGPLRVLDGAKFTGNEKGAIYILTQGTTKSFSEIEKAEFRNNKARSGGAIKMEFDTVGSRVKLLGTVFEGNEAKNGGAIYDTNGRLVIEEGTRFTDNKAEVDGGAIRKCGGVLTLTDGSFENNEAGMNGGAIEVDYTNGTVEKAGFVGNTALQGLGGAIYINENGSITMKNAAITENSAGGIHIVSSPQGKTYIWQISGGAVFGNAGNSSDILQPESYSEFVHSEPMFNGGKHNWNSEKAGSAYVWHADPTNTDISGADVLISGNQTPGQPFGGAVANKGFLIIGEEDQTPVEPEKEKGFTFFRIEELPRTGLPSSQSYRMPEKPGVLEYKPLGLWLEIPSISSMTEIVEVPFLDGGYPVEWLGGSAGLLEGSARPGEGLTVIAGHNHIDAAESGPFALLRYVEEGERIFSLDNRDRIRTYIVYANEKVGSRDVDQVKKISEAYENPLILITCEDETIPGYYENRRIVAARPLSAD